MPTPRKPRKKTCTFCHTTGLSWDYDHKVATGKWRLADSTGSPHTCPDATTTPQETPAPPEPKVSTTTAKRPTDPHSAAIYDAVLAIVKDALGELPTEKRLVEMIRENIKTGIDESAVVDIARKELERLREPTEIIIRDTAGTTKALPGVSHVNFPELLSFVSQREHVWLCGPAGSGKTTAGEQAAEALSIPFSAMSLSPDTSRFDLLGFIDASGNYRSSDFYQRYSKGGLMLFDEADNASAEALNVLNAGLSNGYCAFPSHGMVKRHEDFVAVCSGNTWGMGANRVYVGRAQLDAAFLDRFASLDWPYDATLERSLAGNDEWTDYVQKVRTTVDNLGLRYVISPRASIKGAKMLAAGLERSKVERAYIFGRMSSDDATKVKAAL